MSELGVYTTFVILATVSGVGAVINLASGNNVVTGMVLIAAATLFGFLACVGHQDISTKLATRPAQRATKW